MNDTFQNLHQLELSEPAQELLASHSSPVGFVLALRDAELCRDALRVLPHLLPVRAAAWWGCMCVWESKRNASDDRLILAIEAVHRWIVLPSETNRRTCEHFGRVLGLGVSPGALAMAVFWSGGSMSAPDLPHVDPPPTLAAQVIAGTIQLAAVERDAVNYLSRYRQFLALGLEIASGRNLWTPSGTLADRPERPRTHVNSSRLMERLHVLHTGEVGAPRPHSAHRSPRESNPHSLAVTANEVMQ